MNQDEFDEDHLKEAAKEALNWDGPMDLDRGGISLPEGFGVVYSYTPQARDLVAESNWHAMVDALKTAAGDNAERDIKETSVGHWTYSYFDVLTVRVYDPGWGPDKFGGFFAEPKYTAAFLEAVRCADALHQYPLLDESDYNAREYGAWQREVDSAVAQAQCEFPDDDEDDEQQVRYVMQDMMEEDGLTADDAFGGLDGYTPDNVDHDKVKAWYIKARDEMFSRRVANFWGDPVALHRDTPGSGTVMELNPDQLALFE